MAVAAPLPKLMGNPVIVLEKYGVTTVIKLFPSLDKT